MNWIEGYERRNLDEWQRARLQAYMTYAANTESRDRQTMTEWLPLRGDPKVRRKLMSKKQWEYMKKHWN